MDLPTPHDIERHVHDLIAGTVSCDCPFCRILLNHLEGTDVDIRSSYGANATTLEWKQLGHHAVFPPIVQELEINMLVTASYRDPSADLRRARAVAALKED